jgi:hypothetical protein
MMMSVEQSMEEEETEVLRENMSAALSTINPTWPDPDSNPGRRSGKPVTNCLSYGTAKDTVLWPLVRVNPNHWTI